MPKLGGLSDLVLLALAAHYVTYVVVGSELFTRVRSRLSVIPLMGQAVTCYNCFAFWAAAFCVLVNESVYTRWFLWLCATATLVQLLYQSREKTAP